ncbi:hypothetical protein OS493_002728 [Desmophyllum pertusum]|uniref:KH homology domain-containing protein 4 n=1 Tax=Desmophyllum pertusum TaxID=174260 RepID=A0A9W9YTH3_9CNID|nr:hypothetical protein OS493_002728 [Desmophyllum pertusum]
MAAFRRPRKSKWDVPSTDNDGSTGNGNLSATDAARERAAKLNAMLAAQGKLAKGNPPPALGHPSPAAKVTAPSSITVNNGNNNQLTQDLLRTAEVEINDSPARILLCRGTTQDEINRYSGAAVSTRGKFMSEQEKREAEGTGLKPLYLCIQGLTQEKVDLALKRIREIMSGADVNNFHPPTQPQRMPVPSPMATPAFNQPLPIFDRQPLPPGMHYVQDKVFVGLDNTLPEFNLKEKLQGPGVSYFQHISMQTGAKVQLRGRGSGFIEPTSGKEAFEALYIYISHSKVDGLAAAKKLVENLLQTVHTEYKAFEQTRRPVHYGYSPYMNVGNPANMGQPPSGYQPQPPAYGYPRPPPPGNGYPQPAQPPPGPGYLYNRPPHGAPHQPPPPPVRPGVPHPLPPRYGPPPPQVAGYGNHPPPMGPPARGPAPYQGFPPGPHHQGVHPGGPSPYGPHLEAPVQPPPPSLLQPPPMGNEYQTQVPNPSSTSYQEQPQGVTLQPQELPRRKFTEKIAFKGSPMQDHAAASGPRYQDSSMLNLGEAVAFEAQMPPPEFMPPPPAPPVRQKEREFTAPLPPKDAMPTAVASPHSRTAGKREAPPFSQPAAVAKKPKTEERAAVKLSAIASLAAYGEGDSSDEEGSISPEDNKQDVPQKKDNRENRHGATRLPFWAVRQ